jgi:hypothetical protein
MVLCHLFFFRMAGRVNDSTSPLVWLELIVTLSAKQIGKFNPEISTAKIKHFLYIVVSRLIFKMMSNFVFDKNK